jgi:hypothetical protein
MPERVDFPFAGRPISEPGLKRRASQMSAQMSDAEEGDPGEGQGTDAQRDERFHLAYGTDRWIDFNGGAASTKSGAELSADLEGAEGRGSGRGTARHLISIGSAGTQQPRPDGGPVEPQLPPVQRGPIDTEQEALAQFRALAARINEVGRLT